MNKVYTAVLKQSKEELLASHIYTWWSLWANRNGYLRLAEWLKEEAAEEYGHHIQQMNYLNDMGCAFNVGESTSYACGDPSPNLTVLLTNLASLEDSFGKNILGIMKTAWDQDDHMTYSFMSKFLDIQRESYIKINDYLSVLARTTSEMEFDELFEK